MIEIEDGPLDDISETQEVSRGKIGELMVTGPMVTQRYVVRSDQNPFHKVTDGDRIWHRMGDVGYLDERDRFWFCGRKAHRVTMGKRTLYTFPARPFSTSILQSTVPHWLVAAIARINNQS